MQNSKASLCPCGSELAYRACCGQYIEHGENAPTAEALMRSRYTAYVKQNIPYLRATWYPSTCPANLEKTPGQQWTGLKIIGQSAGQPEDSGGQVEFVARYKVNGRAHKLHEHSEFVQVNGRWLYVGALIENE